ncbi:hypothetical protein PTSG_04633 [Salpingoeca rosetta]|uniref:BZIP domain-containing protein n=1 Tax=Salpingoeca rosetta (strain ATCC 50818 / BSB-021) TaxID=946362 RepID=F2U7Z9_SALR5|nr:uncharacterized protein PTSG_04633 [Salpingoeca rosetta]EGD72904.1 hypothetical protein PTSG_04633 [Salpingoeca rosetta]|eukprot:XP_004994726.1 hypothetical protein PTSG_04633 [Salpingoeca rosetta]
MQRGQQHGFEGLDISGWLGGSGISPVGFSPSAADMDFDAWESAQRTAAKAADFSALAMPPPASSFSAQPTPASFLSNSLLAATAPSTAGTTTASGATSTTTSTTKATSQPNTRSRAKRGGSSRGATGATKRGKKAQAAAAQQQQQPTDMEDGKQTQDKRYLNKLAADKYRRKKRQQFEELSVKSQALETENHKLTAKCTKLESEVEYLKELLLVTVRNSTNDYADAASPGASTTVSSPSSPFDMEAFAKAYMDKHAKEADVRIRQLEEQVALLSDKLQTTA